MSNCSKCNDNVSRCGCGDKAKTNPCTYTDCSVGNERCGDVQDAACVTYGGQSFTIGAATALLAVDTGDICRAPAGALQISNTSSGTNVYVDTQSSSSGWTLVNASPIALTTFTQKITGLTANTAYKVKVETSSAPSGCKVMEVLFKTLDS